MNSSPSVPISPPLQFFPSRQLSWAKDVLNEFMTSYTKNGPSSFIDAAELDRLSALHKDYSTTQRQLEKIFIGYFSFGGSPALQKHLENCGQLRDDIEEVINESLKASTRKKSAFKQEIDDIPMRRDPKTGVLYIEIPNKDMRSNVHNDAPSNLPRPNLPTSASSRTLVDPSTPVAAQPEPLMRGSSSVGQSSPGLEKAQALLPLAQTFLNTPKAQRSSTTGSAASWENSFSSECQIINGSAESPTYNAGNAANCSGAITQYAYNGKILTEEPAIKRMAQAHDAHRNASKAQRSNTTGSTTSWANSVSSECQIINGSAESPTYNGRGAKDCSGAIVQYAYDGKLTEVTEEPAIAEAQRDASNTQPSNTAAASTWAGSLSSESQIINGSAASPTYHEKDSQKCRGTMTQFAYGSKVLTEEPTEELSEEQPSEGN
ncbi:hypothetical protein BJ138DRAFT_519753 [Hygrophoropsis aurantiaca]|uniref:Uncharacterized protein n=1 Tax=Hygrophoropsis aurantiaca TaxID=72124 RepID=A0ACB8A1S7_9AGAM|nr:hypothetical protein BJ138DRAFT_519753 [Hygrophoropsis aurantiaca]